MILTGALVILSRLRLLGVAAGFWLTFSAALGVLALSGHAMSARWHLGPVSDGYFWSVLVISPEVFIFFSFMITDPRTVPESKIGRRIYAVSIGLLGALLIAPQQTEFGAKVGLLGALTIACAMRPVVELLRAKAARSARDTALTRGVGLVQRIRVAPYTGLGAASVLVGAEFAAVLILAGIPARSSAATTGAPIPTTGLPKVTTVAAAGVASIDRSTATRIANDVVADLATQTAALERRDPNRAALGATGDWLSGLRHQINNAAGRPITVPAYRIDQVSLRLQPSQGQAPPTVIATLNGTIQLTSYVGTPPSPQRQGSAKPYRGAFRLEFGKGRFLIATSAPADQPSPSTRPNAERKGSISAELQFADAASVPQGRSVRLPGRVT